MLKLSYSHANYLRNQPESGMGYQNVEAATFDNKTKRGTVYNAELLVFEDEPRNMLRTASFRRLIELSQTSAGEIRDLRVLPRRTITTLSREADVKACGAKEATEEKTKEGEVLKRFVAYEKDIRLQDDNSWSAGTF